MANLKTGMLYYNVDTDRFMDVKIRRLKKDMGCDGFAVYEYLLNEIYRIRGCFLVWDESTAFAAAEYWGLKETKVNEIVRYCCAVGLFDKALLSNGNVLTSSSIQSRYVDMCIRMKRKEIIIPEKFNILPEEYKAILKQYQKPTRKNIIPEKLKIIPEESNIIPEQCEIIPEVFDNNKSKVKNNKEISLSRKKEKKEIPDFSNYAELSLPSCKAFLIENHRGWAESVVMSLRSAGNKDLTVDKFYDWMDKFFDKLANEGETRKSPKDAQKHFYNWLRIQLEGGKQANDSDAYLTGNEELLQSLPEGKYRKFVLRVKTDAPYCFANMRLPSEQEFESIKAEAGSASRMLEAIVQIENNIPLRGNREILGQTIRDQLKFMDRHGG